MTEETSLNEPSVKSDDSCITEYIEIVPLARDRNEFDCCDEIKQELLQDIKQEPADEIHEVCDVKELHEVCDVKDTCTDADVRLLLCICMC